MLPLPSLLLQLIREGRWRHPGDDAVRSVIPFLWGPIFFLETVESIEKSSSSDLAELDEEAREFDRMVDEETRRGFRMARGSLAGRALHLPWLDYDRAVVIAANRIPDEDLFVALDYRTDTSDPRVVATDWSFEEGYRWREVSPTFTRFVEALGL